jgi:multidrug efflux pump subunit AcrB
MYHQGHQSLKKRPYFVSVSSQVHLVQSLLISQKVFKVGVSREQAIVDLNNQLDSNRDWLPQGIGVGQPLVKPRGIDDVPIVSLTLWSKQLGAPDLTRVAHELETELKRIPGTRDIYSLGGQRAVLRVMPDPAALSAHGISWGELSQRLSAANRVGSEQAVVQDNREIKVQVKQKTAVLAEFIHPLNLLGTKSNG